MKPPKALIITPYFYPAIGGAEKQALLLAKGFANAGYNVRILAAGKGKPTDFQGYKLYRYQNFGELIFWIAKLRGNRLVLSNGLFLLKGSGPVINLIEAVILLTTKWLNKRLILRVPCVTAPLVDSKPVSFLLKRSVDSYLPLNSGQVADLLIAGVPVDKIIPLGNLIIPTPHLRPLTQDSPPEVVFTGRLVKAKGLQVLISALKQVSTKINLTLFLSLPDKRIAEWKNYLQLLNQITGKLTIRFDSQRANLYFSPGKIGVFPSVSEGGGNVLREMMAAGMAVIASDIPACSDIIIDRENGLLFKSADPKSLATKLNYLIMNRKLIKSLGKKAGKTIKKQCNSKVIINKILASLNDI